MPLFLCVIFLFLKYFLPNPSLDELDEALDGVRDGAKSKSSICKRIAECRTRLVGCVPILGWRCSLGGADKGGGAE